MPHTPPWIVRNERIKLLATALNNLGVDAILAGVIVPSVNGAEADAAHIAIWLIARRRFGLAGPDRAGRLS
jgi:hypothetical protein